MNETKIKTGEGLDRSLLGERDALHIPVICAKAHRRVSAGTWVGVDGSQTTDDDYVGVIDPFFKGWAEQGEIVAVFLRPGETSNVRHVWEHPLIDCTPRTEPTAPIAGPLKMTMEEWPSYADEIAETIGCSRRVLDNGIQHIVEYGTNIGGTQPNLDTCDRVNWEDFWRRYNESHGANIGWTEDPFCC